jgi:hypothetical protein
VFINDGGTFTQNTSMLTNVSVNYQSIPAFVDIDGDGDQDLLVGSEDAGNTKFYLNDGNNNFTQNTTFFTGVSFPGYCRPALSDIDNDGDFDLFIGRSGGEVTFYENTGNYITPVWTLNNQLMTGVEVDQFAHPGFADLNGDGKTDLILAEYNGNFTFYKNLFAEQFSFEDNFDSYTAGQQLACQNPSDWTTWNLTPCDTVTDAYISDNYSWSPDNTVVIAQNNDLVHVFDPAGPITSGKWYASFIAYIPTGKAGYFNTLAVFDGGVSPDWGVECYFDQGGAGRLLSNSTVFANFNWPEAEWFQVILQVDLDIDQAVFKMATNPNDLTEVATWQWTTGGGGSHPLSLDANDFYGATANDEMYVDEYYFGPPPPIIIPAELTSFNAAASGNSVVLNWKTSTETNNRGFYVERNGVSLIGNWEKIGYVEGSGTTTEPKSYSFTDNNVTTGKYSYRLKQIDFDGSYKYSNIVEVEVNKVTEFSLSQNYPNPFNPVTKIEYSIPEESNISLTVFNILGQKVAELVNGNVKAGNHSVTFNASKFGSGVYYYRLESGNNVQIKKMILLK